MSGSEILTLINAMTSSSFFAQTADKLSFTRAEILGTWIATFLTLCIFSFLYEDNPFYKFAEHLFVGVSAGYVMATTFKNVIMPDLIGNIQTGFTLLTQKRFFSWEHWSYIIAGILGILLILKLVPKISWISRWPLSFMVGISSGLGIVLTMEAMVLKQIDATIVNLIVKTADRIDVSGTFLNWLIVIGVCSGLIYFYFSKEHKGLLLGTASRFGIYVLMMAFGAAFGYTVMARVSLLIGRMLFFRDEFLPVVKATFGL